MHYDWTKISTVCVFGGWDADLAAFAHNQGRSPFRERNAHAHGTRGARPRSPPVAFAGGPGAGRHPRHPMPLRRIPQASGWS